MQDYLNSLIKNADQIQERCTKMREERIANIKSGAIAGQTSSDEHGKDYLVWFGDIIAYHRKELENDINTRSYHSTFYREVAKTLVLLCKTYAAKKLTEHFGQTYVAEQVSFATEDELIDTYVDQVEKLIFGSESNRLMSEKEASIKYPSGDYPLTEGYYVQLALGMTIYSDDAVDTSTWCSAGRWVKIEGSTLLHRDEYFSTIPKGN